MLFASLHHALFLIVITNFIDSSAAISCYNYHTQKNDYSGVRARMINCDQEFNIRSGACLRTEYIDNQGKQMVLGYCGDVCPPLLRGPRHCIYQDGTANYEAIYQISRMTSAVAVCCCDTDFCNSSIRTNVQISTFVFSNLLSFLLLHVYL